MNQYLQSCEAIDWQHPSILTLAKRLSENASHDEVIAQRCFEFVRDKIQHSGDFKRDETTYAASEVLAHQCGWCYAKSHLLAALLRANAIPAGLCYQRLTIEDDHPPHCLHGLNAVYLKNHGWYRIDARGNTGQINAAFCPPEEALAFAIQYSGEAHINGIFAEPLPAITHTLKTYQSYSEVKRHLPDIKLW